MAERASRFALVTEWANIIAPRANVHIPIMKANKRLERFFFLEPETSSVMG
jgi:hypothetical protein